MSVCCVSVFQFKPEVDIVYTESFFLFLLNINSTAVPLENTGTYANTVIHSFFHSCIHLSLVTALSSQDCG